MNKSLVTALLCVATFSQTSALAQTAPANARVTNIRSTLDGIAAQARELHNIQKTQSRLAVNGVMETTQNAVQTMHSQDEQTIEDMQNSGSYDRWGNWYPAYSSSDISSTQQYFQNQESAVQNGGDKDAAATRAAGKATQRALRDSVQSLYSQLSAPATSGVKLNPQGTNLYIRNYEFTK